MLRELISRLESCRL